MLLLHEETNNIVSSWFVYSNKTIKYKIYVTGNTTAATLYVKKCWKLKWNEKMSIKKLQWTNHIEKSILYLILQCSTQSQR